MHKFKIGRVYILLHGAWHGAWAWEKIIERLSAYGHTVYAPDLPGHGTDKTPFLKIKMQNYLECVSAILKQVQEPVILVGHSMAGMIISQVAELFPEKIKKLIYVCAFFPKDGDSMFSLAQSNPHTPFSEAMKAVVAENAFYFPTAMIKDFAYHQCDEGTIKQVKLRWQPEPLMPLATSLKLGENFKQIPKMYIECLEDKALSIAAQRKMYQGNDLEVYSLTSDHSPFYSHPEALTALLLK